MAWMPIVLLGALASRYLLEVAEDGKHQKFENIMRVNREMSEELNAINERFRQQKLQQELVNTQNELYKRGISPKVWPTNQEWEHAMEKRYHDPENERVHCAIAGVAGSGKSSLINAFRGLTNQDSSAAAVDIVESTGEITAYVHPLDNPNHPLNRCVWYDVPGAGTLSVPGPIYFNAKGLFVFDFIILVVDNRFFSQDVAILQQCEYFKIPSFIVRSKANQHLKNMMSENMGYSTLKRAKAEYIRKTRDSIATNLKDGELDPKQSVYIVSADDVRSAVNSKAKGSGRRSEISKFAIDEWDLLKDLETAIVQKVANRGQ